ncbi:SIR2 family protein [Cystobacter fuscus]|uniref:SIR2 family protein n=1 Tax=Cystobacter fuscus TaxID=43 RepID=UPI0009DEF6D7|nr:SIR2 family protein [Cystobacter fuscus]
MSKRVWILGAGFSRPLGGPLLNELMRSEVLNHLEACYPKAQFPKLDALIYDLVLRLYSYGSRSADNQARNRWNDVGEFIWGDAEQFLDYMDTAAAGGAGSPAYHRLVRIFKSWNCAPDVIPEPLELSRAAKRIVAAYCSAFLVGADPSTERWSPFVDWASRLTNDDTIITFNYDCVIEKLNAVTNKIHVVRLGESAMHSLSYHQRARLLKLHGSVNWQVKGLPDDSRELPTGEETVEVHHQPDFDFALKCKDSELAIASPGPLKKRISDGWLRQLWVAGEEAIRSADSIVFIGFRFPPSDSHARERLLTAIRGNEKAYLAVHTVLGVNSPDAQRLQSLLRFALSDRHPIADGSPPQNAGGLRFTLVDHPLYGEDFLSVCPAKWIDEPWRMFSSHWPQRR